MGEEVKREGGDGSGKGLTVGARGLLPLPKIYVCVSVCVCVSHKHSHSSLFLTKKQISGPYSLSFIPRNVLCSGVQ